MKLFLRRIFTSSQGTIGLLKAGSSSICYILELPNKNNIRRLSCIPAGVYNCGFMARSGSGKYKNVWHLTSVKDRTGILIHSGNFAGDVARGYKTHSLGCLLPALKIGKLNGQIAGLKSKIALDKIRKLTHNNNFELRII